jgi:acyl-coenzyme A thioesterase PaaI-like protein
MEHEMTVVNPDCVVCGAKNRRGLHVSFTHDEERGVIATWIPEGDLESFRGTIHGGILGAVLDESMSKAIAAKGWKAFTAELRIRYRTRVSPGDRLTVRGWIVTRNRRLIRAEAILLGADGRERAHAWGAFLA